MQRRKALVILANAAVAYPLAARAQQKPMPVIGFLGSAEARPFEPFVAALRRGLDETGYVEGQNVAIEYRWAEGRYDRLPALAADLVGRKVDLIVAVTVPSAHATTAIPIVFEIGIDPVEFGLVRSHRAAILPGSASSALNCWQSGLSCCPSWFPRPA
jgi:putative ABC transport system substrate-binding protein